MSKENGFEIENNYKFKDLINQYNIFILYYNLINFNEDSGLNQIQSNFNE